MPSQYPRRVANLLLRFAMSVAPPDHIEWARAMQSELDHVEGDWAALRWAIGGASVLARHALVRAVLPGTDRHPGSLAKESLSTEGRLMRKTTLAAAGICAVASLLFFVAPAFRQAFRVSLTQWHEIIHATYPHGQPVSEALARRAEQQHDAEGIAFVAMRDDDETESTRLADEAVHLDPTLTWVYAAVAVRYPMLPEIDGWVAQLEQWDPQNALPYLITAERIDIDQVGQARTLHERVRDEQSAALKNALAGAFASEKLDPYLDRRTALDRRVLLRYSVDEPYQSLNTNDSYFWFGLPSYSLWDCSRYAESLLQSGDALDAQGDREGAREKYLTAARFDDLIGPARALALDDPLQDAYQRLAALSQQDGNKEQANLYVALAASADQERKEERTLFRQLVNGGTVARWDASVVKASGLLMLLFASLALICIVTIAVKNRSLRLASLRASRAASVFLIGSVAGMLLSSAMLYVSYRPYAEIFRSYVRYGDGSRIQDLTDFLSYTQMPLGTKDFNQLLDFEFYFWCSFFALCLIALAFMILRHFKNRLRPSPTI
jgi:hypothetical protein